MRRTVLAGAVALLAATAPLAHGASLSLLPAAGCDVVPDAAGDAVLTGDLPASPEPNAHNWDITGMSYRLSGSTFTVALRAPGLQDGLARGTGDTWSATFTVRGKEVVVQGSRNFSRLPRLQAAYFGQQMGFDPQTSVTVAGAEVPVLSGVQFNKGAGFVLLSVDRAGLEKAVGGSLGTLSKLSGASQNRLLVTAAPVDTVEGRADQAVAASSNTCFV